VAVAGEKKLRTGYAAAVYGFRVGQGDSRAFGGDIPEQVAALTEKVVVWQRIGIEAAFRRAGNRIDPAGGQHGFKVPVYGCEADVWYFLTDTLMYHGSAGVIVCFAQDPGNGKLLCGASSLKHLFPS